MRAIPEGWERAGPAWKLVVAVAFLAVSLGAGALGGGYAVGTAMRYGAALVEGLAFAATMVLLLWWLQPALDELEMWIRLKAYRIAFFACALGLYAYGLLVEAGLHAVTYQAVAIVMFFIFAMATAVVRRWYA